MQKLLAATLLLVLAGCTSQPNPGITVVDHSTTTLWQQTSPYMWEQTGDGYATAASIGVAVPTIVIGVVWKALGSA